MLMILNISVSFAVPTKIKALRINTANDNTRLVFDVSKIPSHKIFQLSNPARLVIDFMHSKLHKSLRQPEKNHPLLIKLRTAARNKHDLRVVIQLHKAVTVKDFVLNANASKGARVVIDLVSKNKPILNKPVLIMTNNRAAKPFIVAVDAGHGGKDPGARGRHGTLEKKVVLQIARKLATLINKQPGMQALMVRKGDYYISLRKRMKIARKADANLFISVHADAFKNSNAAGASVFTLSHRGASSEAARWLAQDQNATDLIGGVSLNDKDNILASVLLDLSQTASQATSQLIAKEILKNLGNIGNLHSYKVQKAGFMVLKSPDIPSILIETAFISNSNEERCLKNNRCQLKIARAIKKGIIAYMKKHTLAFNTTTNTGTTVHKISKGETLLSIALQYGLTLKQLKQANTLSKNNHIRAGQVLLIPVGV